MGRNKMHRDSFWLLCKEKKNDRERKKEKKKKEGREEGGFTKEG